MQGCQGAVALGVVVGPRWVKGASFSQTLVIFMYRVGSCDPQAKISPKTRKSFEFTAKLCAATGLTKQLGTEKYTEAAISSIPWVHPRPSGNA